MKLLTLQISNVLGIIGAEMNFDGAGNLIVIGGENDQGKSSVLSAVEMLISGGDAIPAKPIREGATKAQIIGKTEDFTATRKFSKSGTTLEIKANDGSSIASPQALWESVTKGRSLDPSEFMRQKPKDQLATLQSIVGLDFAALDKEYAEKYAERTAVNRRLKEQQVIADKAPRHPGVPKEVATSEAIVERLNKAIAENQANDVKRSAVVDANDAIEKAEGIEKERLATVERLMRELEDAKALLSTAANDVKEARKHRDELYKASTELVDVDLEAIQTELRELEAVNEKVRANIAWQSEQTKLVTVTKESQTLTERLEAIESEKNEALKKAKFPIEGLGFTADGVTFNALPFEQICTSDQIRISCAIAFALAPTLKVVLVREGSLIGEKNLKLIEELATKNGAQVLMERVSTGKEVTIIMEEGQVSEDRTPAGKAAAKK